MCTVDGAVGELSVHVPDVTATETGRPELAVGSMSKAASPKFAGFGPVKAIVCDGSSPPWEAVIEQLPAPVMCTVTPETVQLPLAANATSRPDDAVAATVKPRSPHVLAASAPNVIVWSALTTVWLLSS
jgi:hypothetical protein